MKKIVSIILVAFLFLQPALAGEIDLSGLSFDELAALRDRCQLEMMNRDQWQEVTVPQGLWEVGVNIPAGTWTVRCADIGRSEYLLAECVISWGSGRPDNDNYWPSETRKGKVEIYNPNNVNYVGQTSEYTITLEKGDFVYIHPLYNRVVFSPSIGAPTFGFK